MLSIRSKAFIQLPALRHFALLQCTNYSTEIASVQSQPLKTVYGFHPNVTTIDAPYQFMVLTKTLHFNQLPDALSQTQESSTLASSLEQLVRNAIVLTVGKDKRVLTRRYKEKPEKELNTSDYYFSLMTNLLRIALTPQGTAQPVLTYRPYVAYEWEAVDTYTKKQEWVRVTGRPFGWLISSSRDKVSRLIIPDREEVNELSLSPLHDLFPVSPLIGLPKYTGSKPSYAGTHPAQEQFIVPHTLLYLHNRKNSHVQNFQSVCMHLFALLASYATIHCGAKHGYELAAPLSAQAILTTGDKFTYFYYQLNTLDTIQLDKGLKNLLYTSDREIPLYQFHLKDERIEEFSFECLRLFVHTLNNYV